MAQAMHPSQARRHQPSPTPLQVLYFGVIDILQAYNMTKKVEHALKSIPHKRNTMSAVDPTRYSKRFQSFLKKVFV
jgi:1-phosphatidylinositol-4-phosphate 5-kinase